MRLIQKKQGQEKFYKRLLEIDPTTKDKFESNDTQRSIRAYEIKLFTKVSMYEWLKKTKPKFKKMNFLNYILILKEKI